MPNHGCRADGTLNDSDYFSLVPYVGLYVGGATLLCLGLMSYDIVKAKLVVKPWIPCKAFALNSVTIALLSIVCKIPLDLTSEMPRKQDQLSKLTGTAVICISMGFIAPSLGARGESDCGVNLLALTIFVITVFFNMVSQLCTGVIGLFIPEHSIILGLMLILLLLLWNISFDRRSRKIITTDNCENLLKSGSPSLFRRLKLCYLYTYCINPQFEITKEPIYAAVSFICAMCLVVVIVATCRSAYFCDGHSHYRWSMVPILAIQILTIVVGSFGVVFRWLNFFRGMEFEFPRNDDQEERNPTLKKWLSHWIRFKSLFACLNRGVTRLLLWLLVVIRDKLGFRTEDECERFDDFEPNAVISAGEYIVRKGVDDMIRLKNVSNNHSLTCIYQYLFDRPPPEPVVNYEIKVCSISIVFLVKIAQLSLPNTMISPMLRAFAEASEIIQFIDEAIQTKSEENIVNLSYAKALWMGGDLSCLVPPDHGNQPNIDPVIRNLRNMSEGLEAGVWSGLVRIINMINPQGLSSPSELNTRIDQMFAYLLRRILADLPVAIFKSLNESSPEEFEDRLRLSMKFLLQTGRLPGVNWSFPSRDYYQITRFVDISPQNISEPDGPLANYREVVPCGFQPEPAPAPEPEP